MRKPLVMIKSKIRRYKRAYCKPTKCKCWFCGGTMIWHNDYDYADIYGDEDCTTGIVTFLRCSRCGADAEFIYKE